jgi:hypothetical protein
LTLVLARHSHEVPFKGANGAKDLGNGGTKTIAIAWTSRDKILLRLIAENPAYRRIMISTMDQGITYPSSRILLHENIDLTVSLIAPT